MGQKKINADIDFKHSPAGYFKYFHSYMGVKLIYNIILSVFLGLLDGLGLALFIPLLSFVNDAGASSDASGDSMGGIGFIVEVFGSVGLPLNLLSVLCLMVIIFLFKGIFNYWLSMEQVDLRQKYMVALRMNQIKNLNALSYQGFLKLDAGSIQNAVTAEVGKNLQAMIQFLATTKAVIILITYVFLAFLANWQFAFFVLIGGVLSNFLYKRITNSVKISSIEISKRGNLFSSYIIQSVHTFKYLKATNYFEKYIVKLREVIGEVEGLNRKIGKNQAITASSREPVIIIIVAAVILIQINYMGANLGSILLSLLLFYRALNGLVVVQSAWQSFMQNVGSLESISALDKLMVDHKEHQADRALPPFTNNIILQDLSFSYGTKRVLNNINLQIKKNETVAFVGESGSGKSTLANLIITLLAPNSGDILFDGDSVYKYNLDSFRDRIGYIAQEPIIYADSIYNNITFWAPKTSENIQKFWSVINQVALSEYINLLPEKEDTVLGDNGMLISGGQKQRISIARELYKDVDILIMDEATSALDSETEHFIKNSINNLQGQYTMIIIAHRLSTIKNADRIYILDKGELSENGSFDELLAKSSKFKNMVSLQEMS